MTLRYDQSIWWQQNLVRTRLNPKTWLVKTRRKASIWHLTLTKLDGGAPLVLDLGGLEGDATLNIKFQGAPGTILVQLNAKRQLNLTSKLAVAPDSKLKVLVAISSNVTWAKEVAVASNSILSWHQLAAVPRDKACQTLDQMKVKLAGANSSFEATIGQRLSGTNHSAVRDWCIVHAAANTSSRFLVKNVLANHASAHEKCLVKVLKNSIDAKTSVYSHALLLDDSAKIVAAPELEVYHQDVDCQHGATSGSLDALSTLYLASRGITLTKIKQLLLDGFLQPMLAPWAASAPPKLKSKAKRLILNH